jgi:alkylated DNA repair dioxygenase AlkB
MRAPASGSLAQAELFAAAPACALPGLKYKTEFLEPAEEHALLDVIRALPLKEAEYKQWRAHRRTIGYGGKYDFTVNELLPAAPIPPFLFALRERIARWAAIPAARFSHALIAEYRAGTQLGWHRDVANFESVVGVSLAGAARMRLRPYPPLVNPRRSVFTLDLEPRSVYALQGAARWDWQHAISATKMLRYSITFRTLVD